MNRHNQDDGNDRQEALELLLAGQLRGLTYRDDYQAAVGRLLISFNDLENAIGYVLQAALEKLGVPHLYKVDAGFAQKVDRLELALCAFPNWPKPDYGRLRMCNGWRNRLAHGQLQQDPNTGRFFTAGVNKASGKAETLTPDSIHKEADVIKVAAGELQLLIGHIWFPTDDE